MVRVAAALVAVLLLGGCVTPVPEPPPARMGEAFRMQAKVSLRAPTAEGTRSGVVLVEWRQQHEAFRVRIADRIGRTVAVVTGDPRSVRIERPGAEPVTGPRTDTLRRFLYAETGFDFPLEVLPWWLRGLPAPDRPSRALPGAGEHRAFEQAGFRIERPVDWPDGPIRLASLDGTGPDARAVLSAWEPCTAEALDAC